MALTRPTRPKDPNGIAHGSRSGGTAAQTKADRVVTKAAYTNWELGKELSNYHFDKSIKDTEAFQLCGRFVGDWKDELEKAYETMETVTWGNRWDKKGLSKKSDPRGVLKENELKDIIDAGGDPEQPMYHGTRDIGPQMQQMIDILGMENPRHKLHIQLTGESVAMHLDKHYEAEEKDDDKDNPEDRPKDFFCYPNDHVVLHRLSIRNRVDLQTGSVGLVSSTFSPGLSGSSWGLFSLPPHTRSQRVSRLPSPPPPLAGRTGRATGCWRRS